jgi:predicted ATPase/DNA-binding SARP family transcriptional activator
VTNREYLGMIEIVMLLKIRLLGVFDARIGADPLPSLRSHRGYELLALLALHREQAVDRQWLINRLWPDSTPEGGRVSLRQSLTDLRRALGPAASCLTAPTQQTLRLDQSVWVDVFEFDTALIIGQIEALRALYHGDLLTGWEGFWIDDERLPRREGFLAALERAADKAQNDGSLACAIDLLRQVTALEPTRESAVRCLMQALDASGQTAAAVDQYRRLRQQLRDDFNVAPSRETVQLHEKLLTREPSQRFVVPPRPSRTDGLELPPIPRPLTTMIGRGPAVEMVRSLLEISRLVTLTGVGGMGKTRLALEITAALEDTTHSGRIAFIDLSSIALPALFIPTLARALNLVVSEGQLELNALIRHLRERNLIVVLDSCEHLLPEIASVLSTVLQACPDLHCLCTSRQPLSISGERLYRVLSLDDAAAMALFVERAQASEPGFAPTDTDRESIQRLCQRLDGLPLALELAAARVVLLAPDEIERRLGEDHHLLENHQASTPRHKSLHTALAWSWNLLSDAERGLLYRLSLFRSSWSLAAAEAVASHPSTLLLIEQLIQKSLIVRVERRYRLLETVREFVLEHQRHDLEPEAIAHAEQALIDWCLALVTSAPDDVAHHTSTLNAETDNIRAALNHCKTPERAVFGLRILIGQGKHYLSCGSIREGQQLYAAFLALVSSDVPERAAALLFEGELFRSLGEYPSAEACFTEALTLTEASGDALSYGDALYARGLLDYRRYQMESARQWITRAREQFARVNCDRKMADTERTLGAIAHRLGEGDQGRHYLLAAISIYQKYNDLQSIASAVNILAWFDRTKGCFELAQQRHEEALAIYRDHKNRVGEGDTLLYLGELARLKGDFASSCKYLKLTEILAVELGIRELLAITQAEFAYLHHDQGKFEAALKYVEQARDGFIEVERARDVVISERFITRLKTLLASKTSSAE